MSILATDTVCDLHFDTSTGERLNLIPVSAFSYEELTEAYNQTRVDYIVPMPMNVAATVRIAYIINGASGSFSTPKNLATDSHAEEGANNPTTASRQKIPAIHKQIFNPRICLSFQISSNFLLFHSMDFFPHNLQAI